MTQDLVSMQITQEQEDQVMALFAQIEALLPGRVTLEPGERRELQMMGPKSERYVRGTITLAQQNAGLIPKDVDLDGALADLDGRERMLRITNRAKSLSTSCEDTTDALGSDLMESAKVIYGILKVLGKASGLEEMLKEVGYRWARAKRKAKTEAPTVE